MDPRQLKIEASRIALEQVKPGMKLGIGTGSTAEEFVRLLGERVAGGFDVLGVPTSERTAELCRQLDIRLSTLDETPQLDLTIDGADEVDPELNLIKGGGGALMREKIVASASDKMTVIADSSKLVDTLGNFPLPIEVDKFGLASTKIAIEKVAGDLGLTGPVTLRVKDGNPFITDGGHLIYDASFGRIPDAKALSESLLGIPGVVEHGLFLNMATTVIIAGPSGAKVLERP